MRGSFRLLFRTVGCFGSLLAFAEKGSAEPSITLISDPTGEYTIRNASVVTPDGLVVGGSAGKKGTSRTVAYLWSKEKGLMIIGDLPGGELEATPTGITDDGSFVVGTSSSENGKEAFGWKAGGVMMGLGDFEGGKFSSRASDVSADGQIIVGSGIAEGAGSSRRHGDGFIWTRKERMKMIEDLGDFEDTSGFSAISADGSTIIGKGSNADGRSEAFRIHKGKLEGLGCLLEGLDFYSVAVAVSSDGSMVLGNSGHGNGKREIFVWTEAKGIHRLENFDEEGRSSAIGLADTGRVLGVNSKGSGSEYFVWDKKHGVRYVEDIMKSVGPATDRDGWFEVGGIGGITPDGRFLVGYGRHRVDRRVFSDSFLLELGD